MNRHLPIYTLFPYRTLFRSKEDGYRQAEKHADEGDEAGAPPAVDPQPAPAPHDDPREHGPGDPPADVGPAGLTVGGRCRSGSRTPARGAVLGHRFGHYQPRVAGLSGGLAVPPVVGGSGGWT